MIAYDSQCNLNLLLLVIKSELAMLPGSTLRNVKAVHFNSSVPSGDSIRPVKHAFQISRTNSGVGIR